MGIGSTKMAGQKSSRTQPLDLRPYAGRWVALVRGRVAGVGWTADEARIAAKLSRPKEEPVVHFVPKTPPRRIEDQTDGKRARRKTD